MIDMKKWLGLIVVLVFAVSIAGCACGTPAAQDSGQEPSASVSNGTEPQGTSAQSAQPAASAQPSAQTSSSQEADIDREENIESPETSVAAQKTETSKVQETKKPSAQATQKPSAQTTKTPESKATQTPKPTQTKQPEKQSITISISIDCTTAVEAGYEIAKEIAPNGKILSKKLTLDPGATVYDALKKSGVVVGASSSAMGKYVYSIQSLSEKACGAESGWVYSVNGTTPSASCSSYELKDGDTVRWRYTLNGGKDL